MENVLILEHWLWFVGRSIKRRLLGKLSDITTPKLGVLLQSTHLKAAFATLYLE